VRKNSGESAIEELVWRMFRALVVGDFEGAKKFSIVVLMVSEQTSATGTSAFSACQAKVTWMARSRGP
jgi:hypothetical protein